MSAQRLTRYTRHIGRGKTTPLRNADVLAGLSRARRELAAFVMFVVADRSEVRMRRFVAYSLETGELYGGTR